MILSEEKTRTTTNRYLRAVASQNESGRVARALCWSDRVFRPTALFHVCGSSASLLPERSLLFAMKKDEKQKGSAEKMMGRKLTGQKAWGAQGPQQGTR